MDNNSPVDVSSALEAALQSEPVILTMGELRSRDFAELVFAESIVDAS